MQGKINDINALLTENKILADRIAVNANLITEYLYLVKKNITDAHKKTLSERKNLEALKAFNAKLDSISSAVLSATGSMRNVYDK